MASMSSEVDATKRSYIKVGDRLYELAGLTV